MYVKDRMTKDPVSIQADAPINELIGLIRDKGLKRIPVLDGEKVVGIVTDGDVEKVSPTKATTLSVFEINYLLSKMTVKDAMSKKVFTITPDDLIEEAAIEMRANRISALPVVENGQLVGIVTESDLMDALIDMLGARVVGTRFVIYTEDKPGILADVCSEVAKMGGNINHMAVIKYDDKKAADLILRLDTLDAEPIIQRLESKGYKITSVIKKRG
ncbi:CBS and ACT domain-containing protein [Bacilliculturomica massiliensis]|uniref:CBS and ACT domain-containing protein n=1 Tax=Bacilliculturomica massiliensis TaxID=1917867 RepID=UPI00102F3849|nr:CBS domain-containing protein [Bacilliculturomica massiliensis]